MAGSSFIPVGPDLLLAHQFTPGRSLSGVLIFVVARSRLDRYEELCLHLEHWRDVRIVLDRREGERRELRRVTLVC
jgi:hypothetical protein